MIKILNYKLIINKLIVHVIILEKVSELFVVILSKFNKIIKLILI